MNNAEQLANTLNACEKSGIWYQSSAAANELRRLAAINAELLEALERSLDVLQKANEQPNGPINDTIWFSRFETLFDFMDAAIASARKQENPHG